jgi:hypothetical protein
MGGFTAVKQVKMRTVLAAIAVVVASTMTYSMTYSGCTSGPGFATTYGSELCAGVVCPCNCCVDGECAPECPWSTCTDGGFGTSGGAGGAGGMSGAGGAATDAGPD